MTPTRRDVLLASALLLPPGLRAIAADPPKKPKPPFLDGNFAPVSEEHTTDALKVTGELPKALDGLFVRNGPNPQFPPPGNYHWFDGDGMLHGVRLQGGRATYRNRFIRTKGFEEEKKAGKATYPGILDAPDLKKLLAGELPYKNPANTALAFHAGKLLALWEVGEPYEIKLPGLDTVGPYTFAGKLDQPVTAHPKVDPDTGEMLFFGYLPTKPLAVFSTANAKGELVRTVAVKLPRPTMIHDFVITKNYAVFPCGPQTFDLARTVKGQSPWHFDAEKPMAFVVVPRGGDGKPLTVEAKTGFAFHFLNAHEADGKIVVVGCRYSRFPGAVSFGEVDADKTPNPALPYQWTLDPKTGKCAEKPLDDSPAEFPRLADSLVGKVNRYGYFGTGDGEFFTGLRKFDLTTRTATDHLYGDGRFGGEGVFVPNPDGRGEDAGWLLNYVYDKAADTSELVVTDAADMRAKPVARVHLPARVPYGFHGTWVPASGW